MPVRVLCTGTSMSWSGGSIASLASHQNARLTEGSPSPQVPRTCRKPCSAAFQAPSGGSVDAAAFTSVSGATRRTWIFLFPETKPSRLRCVLTEIPSLRFQTHFFRETLKLPGLAQGGKQMVTLCSHSQTGQTALRS